MKHLTLLRHAKSAWGDATLDDFDRPLNKRGRRDAPLMGRQLGARGVKPDLLLVSPARRARLTLDAVAEQMPVAENRVVYEPRLYLANLETLLEVLRALDETCRRVMLIGHNPGLTELANYLVDGNLDNLPTCGAFAVKLEDMPWSQLEHSCATTLFYDCPKNIIT